ncbi:winged helix-turn-helix domain-containing protein [Meiothermus hypogaeus]|uniref:Uncharacterized protein n=1 Tax=Meiothermus hypogaeus NBRC 106114 TaxID=1227553 RepID=A0A511QXV1_9DEIN|nr:transcriptional regulator [Meiothermus hypogaeus]GEM82198.1 hypothetical protein MHY01S_03640 [Meiothermus hypogaeus NBRC 106114]
MHWNAIALSVIAALALPVVGLITGRVVGDFFLRGDLIGATGAAFGVLVYALALASSYSHLRHYYKGYEAQGVRASWALALAVEVATFYMSFAYVVIHSAWAFWGSLIGAFVVFWGNLSSMYEARVERARVAGLREEEAALNEDRQVQPAHAVPVAKPGDDPLSGRGSRPVHQEGYRFGHLEALLSAEAVETRISQVRQEVRAVRKTGDDPLSGQRADAAVHRADDPLRDGLTPVHRADDPPLGQMAKPVTLPAREGHEAPSRGRDFPLSETDREVLRLAAAGPVGPSGLSRALGIAKSSAGDRLKRLERMGLLVKRGSSYVPTSHAQASIEGGQALYQGAHAPR